MTSPSRFPAEKQRSVLSQFSIVFELGYLIALPAVAFGFGGAYADKYFGSSPLFVLIGLFLAFAVSAIVITSKVREIVKAL